MSFSLNWYKPPSERIALGSASHPLKGILARRYGVHDGSCKEAFALGPNDVSFIEGLEAASVEGAHQLLLDLREHVTLDVDIS